jgi:hypothetical protein
VFVRVLIIRKIFPLGVLASVDKLTSTSKTKTGTKVEVEVNLSLCLSLVWAYHECCVLR